MGDIRFCVKRFNLGVELGQRQAVHNMRNGLSPILLRCGDGLGRIDKQSDAGCNHQNPGGSWDETSGRNHFLKKDQDHQASNPKQVHDSAYKE